MSEAAEAHEIGHLPPPTRRLPVGAVVAVGLVSALFAGLIAGNDEDLSATKPKGSGEQASFPVAQPVAATAGQLGTLARSVEYPIYWQGRRPNVTFELTRMGDGRVFIRYLTGGADVANRSLRYPFVATYPDNNAFRIVQAATKAKGAIVRKVPGGAIAVANRRGEVVRSTARELPVPPVFFAYPDSPVLVEVYDPVSVNRAFRRVASGQVGPIPR
jgi:hypothetical protein